MLIVNPLVLLFLPSSAGIHSHVPPSLVFSLWHFVTTAQLTKPVSQLCLQPNDFSIFSQQKAIFRLNELFCFIEQLNYK